MRLKSRTSLRTFDIMLKLPSRALNSMSWVFATVPEASMFWTANKAVFNGTRTSWKTYDVRRRFESAALRSLT